jgi:hypothetical protein
MWTDDGCATAFASSFEATGTAYCDKRRWSVGRLVKRCRPMARGAAVLAGSISGVQGNDTMYLCESSSFPHLCLWSLVHWKGTEIWLGTFFWLIWLVTDLVYVFCPHKLCSSDSLFWIFHLFVFW